MIPTISALGFFHVGLHLIAPVILPILALFFTYNKNMDGHPSTLFSLSMILLQLFGSALTYLVILYQFDAAEN